jgi:hypothetical protein
MEEQYSKISRPASFVSCDTALDWYKRDAAIMFPD